MEQFDLDALEDDLFEVDAQAAHPRLGMRSRCRLSPGPVRAARLTPRPRWDLLHYGKCCSTTVATMAGQHFTG